MPQDYFKNNYYAKFKLTGTTKAKFWQIMEREALEFETGSHSEFSAVTTGNTSGDIEITYLEPSENELYYIIPGIEDGCTYYFRIPAGIDRLGVAKDQNIGFVDNIRSPYFLPNPQYSFFMAIKTKFTVDAHNDTGSTVTPKLFFTGMKYRIQEVTDEELLDKLEVGIIPSTPIQLGGFTR